MRWRQYNDCNSFDCSFWMFIHLRKEESWFRVSPDNWEDRKHLNYLVYPLDEEVILSCQDVKEVTEPHDRIIVATAKLLNARLITKDEKIRNSKIVETIW